MWDKQVNLARWVELLVIVGIARKENHIIVTLLIVAINFVCVYKVFKLCVVVNGCNFYAYVAYGDYITSLDSIPLTPKFE